MLVIFAFVSFLFYKIMPEFLFGMSNTVLGSAIMAIFTTLCLAVAQALTSVKILIWAEARNAGQSTIPLPLAETVLPFIAAAIAAAAGGRLIAVGFAAKLSDHIFGWWGQHETLWPWFYVMLVLPVFSHYVLYMAGARSLVSRNRMDI